MCQGHDHNHEEEIDLVDILGVIIKRRKFIVWFIVCFTILTSILVFLMEYKKSAISLKSNFTARETLTTQNDLVLASYIFLNKSDKQERYHAFLSSLLFPAVVDAPTFEVQKGESLNVDYLFVSSAEAKRFSDRYNEFVDQLVKLKTAQNSMSEGVRASCSQFKSTTIDSTNGAKNFFSNSNDAANCNLYYAYFGLIHGRLKYVMGSDIEGYYFPFICDAIKDAKISKLKPADAEEVNDIKIKAKRNFNMKKVIKHSALFFVFSIVAAFIMAFAFEFWTKNKDRFSGYLR